MSTKDFPRTCVYYHDDKAFLVSDPHSWAMTYNTQDPHLSTMTTLNPNNIPSQELFFKTLNPSNSPTNPTIVFLHGANSCHLEWIPVASNPALQSFHLLLLDLPGHSGSRSITPFSLPTAADAIAHTIKQHAHGGRAHVVGLSLGGFTALELAARHPDVVSSCFSTGAMPWRGVFKWFGERPRLVYYLENAVSIVPFLGRIEERVQGFAMDPQVKEEAGKNRSWELTKDVYGAMTGQFGMETVRRVREMGIRTVVIAGGKMDQVEGVRRMGVVLKEGDGKGKNRAVVVRAAVHLWSLQLPELFARGLKAWIEKETLPVEFEEL
ncbi:Alpha/Beta hydrolase protein [Xylariales sp. AK1849]|nr:Alpha/Beta hydrolase protein [Xylariales sp. AK1849]